MQSTLENYQKVYEMLEDDQSKFIYLNRLSYLISDNYNYIKEIIPEQMYSSKTGRSSIFIAEILRHIPSDAEIILYGTGQHSKQVFSQWDKDKRIIGFCSNNKEKQETGYLGYSVMSPEELIAQNKFFVIVTPIKAEPQTEILDFLERAQYPKEKIFCVAKEAESEDAYFPQDIVQLQDEVFIDAGCYRLETSLELKKRCLNVEKIYAFEPDPENYKYCLERKEQACLREAEIFPFGTWSFRDTLYFDAKGSSSCIVDSETSLSVNVVSIDEIVYSEESPKVTFIKMDIEGAELESLKGAQKVIQRDKPKLAICIYHKPEDMVKIPLYIKELVPEYKLYIRHHSNFIFGTVLYAIP